MKVTREEARRIADLARLDFDDAGLDRIAAELTEILTYVDQLKEADTATAAASEEPHASTALRDDIPRPALDRDTVEGNAPAWTNGFLVVPKILGDGS